MSTLKKIRKMKAELDETIKKEGKIALREMYSEFFEANPHVIAVRWTQYTPYFNDGEPCEFSVGEVEAKLHGGDETDGDHEDGFLSAWDLNRTTNSVEDGFEMVKSWNGQLVEQKKYKTVPVEPIDTKLAKVLPSLSPPNDVALAVFGDHVQVTVTRKGFTVDECAHD